MESSKPDVFLQSGYVDFARLPNLITIAADVLAGYWIANGMRVDARLFWLLVATSAVYLAGLALNDFCTRDTDSPESAKLPIPDGRVEPWKALMFSISLFTIGFGASVLAGASAPQITILLIFTTILYNVGTKERVFLGPGTLAGYRSLNLILGMGLPSWLGDNDLPIRYFPVFSFLYVFLLSWLSRFEMRGKSSEIAAGALLGWAHFVTILVSLSFWGAMKLENLPFLALFMAFTGPTLLNAGRLQTAFATGGAQKMLVLGIPLLNAVYCAGVQGFAAGIPIALCTVIASVLAMSKKVSCDLTRRSPWGKESF